MPGRNGNGAGAAAGGVRPSREAVAAFRELTRLQNLATRRTAAAEAAAPASPRTGPRISASAAASADGGASAWPRDACAAVLTPRSIGTLLSLLAAHAPPTAGDVRGAIEANSPYIAAVRRDVEVHGDAIPALAARAREARAEGGSLAPVRACLASLEATLSRLTDERAVLKHFDWPEAKVRAL